MVFSCLRSSISPLGGFLAPCNTDTQTNLQNTLLRKVWVRSINILLFTDPGRFWPYAGNQLLGYLFGAIFWIPPIFRRTMTRDTCTSTSPHWKLLGGWWRMSMHDYNIPRYNMTDLALLIKWSLFSGPFICFFKVSFTKQNRVFSLLIMNPQAARCDLWSFNKYLTFKSPHYAMDHLTIQ